MIKISFWLKNSGTDQGSLQYTTIANPQKILEGKLTGIYYCEVYLPIPNLEKKQHLIYAGNPVDALCLASEFVKSQLQFLINHDYIVSEVESHEPWKLEKKDPQVYLQEKINGIKSDKNISQEGKQQILVILKETFGKSPSPIKDQINKEIDKI